MMKTQIISHLPTECPWRDTLYWYDTIDSTNTQAKKMAKNGAKHGTVLIAKQQTQGRGRMGRQFHSPAADGIYLSVILRPHCPPAQLMHLTCAVAVAVCDGVEKVTGFRPGVKWINDLVAKQKKLGGILTELSIDPATQLIDYAIVGIGINCFQKPSDFPAQLQEMAISLETVTGIKPSYPQLVAAMIQSLWNMDKMLLCEKERIMIQYRNDCITLGQEVLVLRGEGKQQGTALGVDNDGQLLVRFADGHEEIVNSGEVSCRGLYGYSQ